MTATRLRLNKLTIILPILATIISLLSAILLLAVAWSG
jgi:hypothetical protein